MTKPHVLFIEDYPVVRDMYVDVLKQEGFIVDSAPNGKEALKMIKEKHYDLIVLDLLLPLVSGMEFLRAYNKDSQKQDVKTQVIVLTDFDKPETKEDVMKLGVSKYWVKIENTPHRLAERLKLVLSHQDA